jgi:glycosyltransferase involved in cell wall biosynthesis
VFTQDKGFPKLLSKIKKIIKENNLEESIVFKGIVSRNELKELLTGCSLAIVNKPENTQNNYNFPTKLTELLMNEIPVIVSKTGEINNYFSDGVNAFMVTPNNIKQIAEKIIYIIKYPKEAQLVATKGKEFALQEFYYMNYADTLYTFFTKILNNEFN